MHVSLDESLALESTIERSFGKAVYIDATKRPAEQFAINGAE